MKTYVLEVTAIMLRGTVAVGYGNDLDGREFAFALDLGLAADLAVALDNRRRPIVAVEEPLYGVTRGYGEPVRQVPA